MGSPKLKTYQKMASHADDSDKNVRNKKEIEVLISQISSKLRDPELAKKAAQIIEEWAQQVQKKDKK